MGCSPTTPWAAVCMLLLVVVLPNVQTQSPCGDTTISIGFTESTNGSSFYVVPTDDRNMIRLYTKQIVDSDNPNLQITITNDNTTSTPPGLDSASTFANVTYNALSVPRGYYLFMKKVVDRDGTDPSPDDDVNTLQYKLTCIDRKDSTIVFYHVLKIQMLDQNDNAPEFQSSPYEITVDELTPVGMTVFSSITATDLDNGNNKLVKYSIATADDSQFMGDGVFNMTSEYSGIVVLMKALDYEAMVNKTGSASLTVYRMNITATPPTGSLQVLPVPRLSDPSQTVPIKARDGDSLNASVLCSIAYTDPTGYENRFTVTTQRINTSNEYECSLRVISSIYSPTAITLDVVLLATEQTRNSYSEEAVVSLEITPSNMSFPHTTTMRTTSSGPCEDGPDVVAIVGVVIGVLAALTVIIIITVICLRSRKEADVPVTEMVTRPTGRGDSGTLVLRDTTAVNAGIPLQPVVGSSTENGASQRPSSETVDDYEIADATSAQQDRLEPVASTTDPTYVEILDDQLMNNYDRPQMYENTRGHHDYTDLKSQ